jgi:hypothetical protein
MARTQCCTAWRFVGAAGQVVVGLLVGLERAAFQEGHRFVQDAGVAAAQRRSGRWPGQPQVVVGKMGAHAAPGGGMPPVLHIAFAELAGGARSRCSRAAGRARRGPAPWRPATGRGSRRRRRTGSNPLRAHMRQARVWYSSQPLASTLRAGRAFRRCTAPRVWFQNARPARGPARAASLAEAVDQRLRIVGGMPPTPSRKTISRSCPVVQVETTWIAAQGSRPLRRLPDRRVRVRAAGLARCRCGR